MVTKRFLNLFLLLILVVLFVQCSQESNWDDIPNEDDTDYVESDGDYELAPNSFYATKEVIDLLIEEATESKLIFKNSQKEKLPKVGQVWIFPISQYTPNGFLGRIVDVKEKEDIVIVSSESINIENVFKSLNGGYHDDNFCARVTTIQDANGENIEFELHQQPATRLDIDSENKTFIRIPIEQCKIDGFTVRGDFEFAISLDFHIGINDFKIEDFKLEIVPEILNNYECSFETSTIEKGSEDKNEDKNEDESEDESEDEKEKYEKVLAEWTLKSTPIPVVGPLIIYPKLIIKIVAGVRGKVSVKTTIQHKWGATYTMLYMNSNWYGSHYYHPFSKEPLKKLSLDMDGEAYVGAVAGLFVGFCSPFAGVTIDATGKLVLASSFKLDYIIKEDGLENWNADLGAYADLKLAAKFTRNVFKTFDREFATSENRVVIGHWPLLPAINWSDSGTPIGSLKLKVENEGLLSRWYDINIKGKLVNIFEPNEKILDEYVFEKIDSTYLGKEVVHTCANLDERYPYQWKCYMQLGDIELPISGASGHNNWDYNMYMVGNWINKNREGELCERASFNNDNTYTWSRFLNTDTPTTDSGYWFCDGNKIILDVAGYGIIKNGIVHDKTYDKDQIGFIGSGGFLSAFFTRSN